MSSKIKLKFPVEVDGQTYAELTMRRCKVKDRRAATKQWNTDEDREIGLIANLCDVTPKVIEELDAADYKDLLAVLVGFIGSAMPT